MVVNFTSKKVNIDSTFVTLVIDSVVVEEPGTNYDGSDVRINKYPIEMRPANTIYSQH